MLKYSILWRRDCMNENFEWIACFTLECINKFGGCCHLPATESTTSSNLKCFNKDEHAMYTIPDDIPMPKDAYGWKPLDVSDEVATLKIQT